jgi:hypothetical protein
MKLQPGKMDPLEKVFYVFKESESLIAFLQLPSGASCSE